MTQVFVQDSHVTCETCRYQIEVIATSREEITLDRQMIVESQVNDKSRKLDCFCEPVN